MNDNKTFAKLHCFLLLAFKTKNDVNTSNLLVTPNATRQDVP